MRWPSWTKNLGLRRRRRTASHRDSAPFLPRIYRLEDRRVLDVSAAFSSVTGQLELLLTNASETAAVSVTNGDITITNSQQQNVDIIVDGAGPAPVNASAVDSIQVIGDAGTGQGLALESPLALPKGLSVDASIEQAVINADLTRVDQGPIRISASTVLLGADVITTGQDVSVEGAVQLTDSVRIVGHNVNFASSIDDDGVAATPAALLVEADGLTRFGGAVGAISAVTHLETDAAGRTELNGNVTASGNTVLFNDAVTLTNHLTITDNGPVGIIFGSTVDSATDGFFALRLAASDGQIKFNDNIGAGTLGDQRLGLLIVNEAADGVIFGDTGTVSQVRVGGPVDLGTATNVIGGVGVVLNGGVQGLEIATEGSVRINGATALQTDVSIATVNGDITFTSDALIDSQANLANSLTLDARAGAVFFNADIGSTSPLRGLTVTRADAGVLFGASDSKGVGGPGPVSLVSSVDAIVIGSAANAIAGGITFNAGIGNTIFITTTNDAVSLHGPVVLESDVSISTGPGPGDISFFGAVNSSDESSDITLNAGTGSISFSKLIGAASPIGDFSIVQADGGVTFTTLGNGGPGLGMAAVLTAAGTIDIGVGANEISGTGITFDGGNVVSAIMRSLAGDIRLNGPVVLGTTLRITSGGDVTFTNDSPIDSGSGGGDPFLLVIDAPNGGIFFNEDIGRSAPLSGLSIGAARDGVFLGQSTNEIPGTGGLGPVELVRLVNALDIGSGTNVVGGAGIVLNGSAIAPLHISTSGGSVRFNGAVTLQTDVTIDTGSTGADIVFTNATSIDSGTVRQGSLTLDAGAGRIVFNEDIGALRAIGSLIITEADGGVVFGGADSESAGRDALGPVNSIHTAGPIDIGVGAALIGGSGIVFNGGPAPLSITTTDDSIRFNGPVKLQSDLQMATGSGPGDVTFTSAATIDSHDGPVSVTTLERNDLVIDAGDGGVFFNADIGAAQAIGSLIVDRAARGVVFGGADTAAVGGTGPVTQITTDGEIDLGTGDTIDDVVGTVVFNAGANEFVVQTTGDDIRINGPVLLQSDLSLSTGPGSGDLTVTGSIDGQSGEVRGIQVTLDAGDAQFGGPIGSITRLGNFILHSAHNADFDGAVFASRMVQESGTGETAFHGSINTNHATNPGLELNGTTFSFEGPILATGDGRVSIEHRGTLDIHPGADFRIDGTFIEEGGGSPVNLAANLATSGDSIDFDSPVVVGSGAAQVLLSTVAGGQATGADIHFRSTLNGQTAGSQNVLLNAGTDGRISFDLTVGAVARLGVLTVVQADNLRFNSHLIAARIVQLNGQNSSFAGRVDLNHPTLPAMDIKSVNIGFLGPVTTTGHGAVLLNVSGLLGLTPEADMNLNGTFQQVGDGESFLRGDITTTDDDIHFAGAFIVNGDVRLDTGSGPGSILFDDVVGIRLGVPHDLTLDAGTGDIIFTGPIGQITPLDELRIESARDVQVGSGARATSLLQISGSGITTLLGGLFTTGPEGVQLTTANIAANGTIDTRGGAGGPIALTAANDIDVNGGLLTGSNEIELTAGGDVTFGPLGLARTSSARITIIADSDQNAGGAILMAAGALADSGTALLRFTATDDITIGRLISASQVTLTSTAGAIVDAGDANGADIVTPRLRLQAAAGIGTDALGSGKDAQPANPLETEVSLLAAANTTAGGIHITNRLAGPLTIAEVDGLVGLNNGGDGAIEVSNVGELRVNAPVLNHGGGDTRLQAEILGDLVVNRPVQNSGGDGSIFLFSGRDLIIHDSLPEPPGKIENPQNPEQFFEIMVTGEGAVRGEAGKDVVVDDGDENYVIIRTATGQITNILPILSIRTLDQGGSDIDEQGIGFVEVKVGDSSHLETNFHIQIDWGDGEIESFPIPGTIHPQRDPGNTDPRFDGGQIGALGTREPGTYIFKHKYFAHPNPDDPSAPIPIRVELRTDARASGESSIDANRPVDHSAIFNGIRFVNNVANVIFTSQDDTFSVPGTGNFTFVKIVESVIVPVETRTVVAPPPLETAVSFASNAGLRTEFRVTKFEAQAQADYRLFMVVVDDAAGKEGQDRIELSLELLSDPLSLFRTRRFPNGHYRIYLEEIRTRRIRLILDVHIFDGKVVPPNFRDGAGEKQPGAEQRPAPMAPGPQPNANAAIPLNDSQMSLATEQVAFRLREQSTVVPTELSSAEEIQFGPPRLMSRIARFARKLRAQ